MRFLPNIIDGRERDSAGGLFDSIDPWTRTAWARAPRSGRDDVDAAVGAARRAADRGPWPRMGSAERGALLHALADLVVRDGGLLAEADTSDVGRPLAAVRDHDVPRAARNFRFFADHARLGTAERYPSDAGFHTYSRHEPAGVVAAVSPWNYPLMLASWKIAPALAWGNAVVLKPAEQSPGSVTRLAALALEAGFPPGVLNVVHGHGRAGAGEHLVGHPGVDRVTFTGSSTTGRAVATAAAANLTPVSMELGGKGAALVFADADLDVAVDRAAEAAFGNAGQMCLAGSRILVAREVFDVVVERLAEAAASRATGDPRDPATAVGPLATAEHHAKVVGHLDRAAADGWTAIGAGHDDRFVRPTLLLGGATGSEVWREEVFGPVATVTAFDSEDEAVALAGDTRYGLNAVVFTTDVARAHRVAGKLGVGTVWVNCFFVRDLRAPFGGAGSSGIGREGGSYSRDFFTEPKTVTIAVPG
ncbi:aldehyde dehydrogenase family protein [Actinosynnema sp. NPDC050436]|uniref:aldehyde dehydrogenase family protein n=1 Tax=Actinosynnema sp. NPDC050436 TaxID=3155659 RepID=UPI0033C6A046